MWVRTATDAFGPIFFLFLEKLKNRSTITAMDWSDLNFIGEHWVWFLAAVIFVAAVNIIYDVTRQRYSGKWFRHGTPFFRALLIAVAFSVILVAIHPLRTLLGRPFQNGAAVVTESTEQSQTSAAAVPDQSKANMDELKWLLTILAGFAVITSIAQVAAAWFSALTYDKQASAKLDQIQGALDDLKAKYPIFSDIEEKRNQVHDAFVGMLRRVFSPDDPDADPTEAIAWSENFYPKFPVEDRQLLLSVESFISIDLHPPRNADEVQSLKVFAIFYHAKFRYEKKMLGSPLFSDLERAEGYILRALKKAPADFTLHNELGNIYLTMKGHVGKLPPEPEYAEKARAALDKSLYYRPSQQRAYYNLAFLLAEEKKHKEAAQLLKTGLDFTTWQRMTTPDAMLAYMQYNLGCYRARFIAAEHMDADAQNKTHTKITSPEAELVTSALQTAAGLAQILPAYVDHDFDGESGDIFPLYQNADPDLKKKLDALREQLKLERTKKSPKGFFRTLAEASQLVRDAAAQHLSGIFKKP
jgi:hypothetical protein